MKPTLNDIGKILKQDETKADKSQYGVVLDTITSDSGIVTGYKVSLGNAENIVEARKFAGASIGDVVMVTLMSNGSMVVTGRRDGDGDTIDFIKGANDGSLKINGECLDSVGGADHLSVSENAISLVGTDTQFTMSNGTFTAAYQGSNIMRLKSADATTQTYSGAINVREGRSETVDIYNGGAIQKVMVQRAHQTGLIRTSQTIEIGTDTGAQIYYSSEIIGNVLRITIHVKRVTSLTSTSVTNVTVTYATLDNRIFEIGNESMYVDGNGNAYATSFNQINAPVMSYAPSGGNGIETPLSSRKIKHDIKDCEIDVHGLYDVPVRQFKYNNDYLCDKDERYGADIVGLIAEEVDEVFPIGVDHREVPMWNSQILIPAMLKLIQEQKTEIDNLNTRIETLEGAEPSF